MEKTVVAGAEMARRFRYSAPQECLHNAEETLMLLAVGHEANTRAVGAKQGNKVQ